MTSRLLSGLAVLAFLVLPLAAQVAPITVGDADRQLVFEDGADGLTVRRLVTNDAGTFEFLDRALFELTVLDGGVQRTIGAGDFSRVTPFVCGCALILTFTDQNVTENRISVTVFVDLEGDEFVFRMGVWNRCRAVALNAVQFPRFRPAPVNPGDPVISPDLLQTPFGAGASFATPTFLPQLVGIGPSNVSMQHFTFWDRVNDRALYWATKDGRGYRRRYVVQGAVDSLDMSVTNYPINNERPGNDYISLYPTVLTGFNGDWYDGAVRYREWALQQRWAQRGRVEDNPAVSQLARDAKLHVLQYPDHTIQFDDFTALAADLQRLQLVFGLGADEIVALWSDINLEAFNVLMPDFTGPRDSVADGYAAAAATGINVIPYIQVDLWSPDGAQTAALNARDVAYADGAGELVIENAGPRSDLLVFPHFQVDPTFSAARAAKVTAVTDALDLTDFPNNAGIYLDTWSGRPPELNQNPRLFLKGGTSSWSRGLRAEGQTITDLVRARRSDGLVSSEFPNEALLDKTDLTFYAPLDFGQVQLPVWETVYHEYALNASLSVGAPNRADLVPFLLAVTNYDYHLGKITALTNFMADDLSFIDPVTFSSPILPVYQFLQPLLALEDDARRFRIFGERLRPLSSSVEASITNLDYFLVGPPSAASSIWRASNGDVGIILTNSSPFPQAIDVNVDFDTYGLSGAYDVFTCFGGVRVPVARFSDSFAIPFPLAPFSATLLELVPVPAAPAGN